MILTPDFQQFSRVWRSGKNQTVSTGLVNDLETPVSAMLKLGKGDPYAFLLESIEGGDIRGRYSIIGRDPDVIWRCNDGKAEVNRNALRDLDAFTASSLSPLEDLRALLSECRIDVPDQPLPMASGMFGYLGYDMARQIENIPSSAPANYSVPDSVLLRPTLLAIFDQIENRFNLVTPVWFDKNTTAEAAYAAATALLEKALEDLNKALPIQPVKAPKAIPAARSNMDEAGYVRMVERGKEYIRAGDAFQLVLSQRFSQPFTPPPFNLYRAIRRLDPSPFLYFFNMKDFSIVGSSPEILVRVRDGKVTIRPIAGTRPRGGASNRSDAELEKELLADPKELAEHLMLVDLGRNDVGKVSKIGTVKVTARNDIEKYKHVMHIVSNVEGELKDECDTLDALMAGFPAGTVSGAPKIRAMEIIAELEPDKRGIYAGCIGYFGANGSMDSCIAIRTAVIKDGVMHVQVGAGIVYDSDPQSEYRECAAKARGMMAAAETAMRD
ncbi:MAG: anthranilate synthase component I [Alphaproteobacteria bacterium]|nr:anthranilate synthase component I [Alphaproteobacteria bacterium]